MSDRETELQANNTSLVNEVRMLRAQLHAAKAVMRVAFIDRPMTKEMPADGVENEDLRELYDRLELLEKDAWTQTGALAKQFVKYVKEFDPRRDDAQPVLEEWAEKFKALVGD